MHNAPYAKPPQMPVQIEDLHVCLTESFLLQGRVTQPGTARIRQNAKWPETMATIGACWEEGEDKKKHSNKTGSLRVFAKKKKNLKSVSVLSDSY